MASTVTAILLGGGRATADVTITPDDEGNLAIAIDGEPFTVYRTDGASRPTMYPIMGPGGVAMTRDFPFRKDTPGEAHDHPHHQSFWIAHGDINKIDFWTSGPGKGIVKQREVLHQANGANVASLATANQYLGPDGKLVCTDTREFWFGTIGNDRYIDTRLTYHASQSDLVFGDTKEGMFAFRTHANLRLSPHKSRGPDARVGQAVNSEGDKGKALWGKRSAWVDYWGTIDGKEVGIAIFDHPSNPRHPTWWHARDYGLVAANPFGIHNFESKPPGTGDMKLPKGQDLTFYYRVIFHAGTAEEANVEQRFEEFGGQQRKSILSESSRREDSRLARLQHLNGYFPFTPPESTADWQDRARQVRRRILVTAGLWPMPPRPPVKAVTHGRVDRDDYTVERVYLESYPGHFVTGSLYRPKAAADGLRPAILSPHGHWPEGRFHDHGPKKIKTEIAVGAERFEESGRFPIQARCVQLARMGCVVFNYDMVGYADSVQIPFQIAHRSPFRPHMNDPAGWGFFSAQAELRLQSILGLQTFNSIRALDWLASLPGVDPDRLAVTGCSGGGTQTMLLSAIDPRVAVSFPAVMVSTAMQGGCTCENASLLRVGTGNVEFAALFAPRPLGLTGADDWTIEIESKGLPELRQLYALLGAEQAVFGKALDHFEHNFNHVSRTLMYQWMNRHLELGLDEPVLERDFVPLSREELSVWNEEHPPPAHGEDVEREFLIQLDAISTSQLAEMRTGDAHSRDAHAQLVREALQTIVGREMPVAGTITATEIRRINQGDYEEFHHVLHHPDGEQLPVQFFYPHSWQGDVVVVLHGQGRGGVVAGDGQPGAAVDRLLESGLAVVVADLFGQGEWTTGGRPSLVNRHVPNSRFSAGYTYGYNHPLLVHRVHDILSLLSFIAHDEHQPRHIHLIGLGGAAPAAAIARLLSGDTIATMMIDAGGFRFADVPSWRDANFLPGAVKYGDMPGLLGLVAPAPLWVGGEDPTEESLVAESYGAEDASENLTFSQTPSNDALTAAVDWLTDRPHSTSTRQP